MLPIPFELTNVADVYSPHSVFSAVTTASPQTVTIQRLTPTGRDITIDWGDGNVDVVLNGTAGVITHVYITAGTYPILIGYPAVITYFDLRDDAIHFNTGTIANMRALAHLNLLNLSAGYVGAGEIALLTALTYLGLGGCPQVTIGLLELDNLTLLVTLYAVNMALMTVSPGSFTAFWGIHSIQYENSLTQPQVDAILSAIFGARMIFTYATPDLKIAGSNAAPSGIYQDDPTPSTGLEWKFKLQTDPDGEGFNKWTITNT
jgi:hypothetical protein